MVNVKKHSDQDTDGPVQLVCILPAWFLVFGFWFLVFIFTKWQIQRRQLGQGAESHVLAGGGQLLECLSPAHRGSLCSARPCVPVYCVI